MASAVAFRGSCHAANARAGKRASRAPLVVRATAGAHPRLRLDGCARQRAARCPRARDGLREGVPAHYPRPSRQLAQQLPAWVAAGGAEARAQAFPRVTRAVLAADPATESKNLEVMRKFSEQYAKRCAPLPRAWAPGTGS
jgi:hypothetical protein